MKFQDKECVAILRIFLAYQKCSLILPFYFYQDRPNCLGPIVVCKYIPYWKMMIALKIQLQYNASYDVLKNKPTTEVPSILIQNSLWDIILWCCIYLSADEPILASSIHCQIKENRLKKHLILHLLLWRCVWRLCGILQRPSKTNKEFNVAMKKSKNEFFMNV